MFLCERRLDKVIIFSKISPNMFKVAKELRSSLITNSLKSFVVSPLIKKFQVSAVRAICIGNLSKENIWLPRRKMEKVFEDNEHIVCFFFGHYCYGGKEEYKSKEEER